MLNLLLNNMPISIDLPLNCIYIQVGTIVTMHVRLCILSEAMYGYL